MSARGWTREEIESLVAGASVCLRDESAQELPVPTWLSGAAADITTVSAAERLAMTHPDDRTAMTLGFLSAVDKPGELVDIRYRVRIHGGWTWERLRFLSLLDQEALGAVLLVTNREEAEEGLIDTSERPDPGDSDATDWLIQYLDRNAVIFRAEGRVQEILGCSAEEMIGRTPLDFVHRDCYADSLALWFDLVEHPGSTRTTRRRYVRLDGGEVWCEASYLNRLAADGTGEVVVLVYDITERRAQEEALRLSEEESHHLAREFRSLAEEVPTAVFRAEVDGRITFFNNRFAELLGHGSDVTNLTEVAHPDDQARLHDELEQLASDPSADSLTIEIKGCLLGRALSMTCRTVGDATTGRRSFVGSIDDLTDTVHLRQRATTDALTGLLNRQAFEDLLEAELRDDPEDLVVAFLDLDGFKQVNDNLGHDAGDEVLRAVAGCLGAALRPADLLGRHGGDEFVVACRWPGETSDQLVSRRLTDALAAVTAPGCVAAASIGVVRPRPEESVPSVLSRADAAMFAAKHQRHLRLA
jgi:diguanylate cyclase (GGDEF)-like protein/PAS domain S-box-containing protein